MNNIMGIEYGRGCLRIAINGGPALAPAAIKEMFPNADWTTVIADAFDANECARDRFGENYKIQQKIYVATPYERHIMIGGDHSVNYGHFVALSDRIKNNDLCLIYIDAHLDIHTPESARIQASGAPHGTNVRALMGDGDERWLSLQKNAPALTPDRVFYLGTRSYEPAEIEFVRANNIFMRTPEQLKTESDWHDAVHEIRRKIGNRPFVVSFDFDAIDPKYFSDILVPAPNGLTVAAAEYFIREFDDAISFEFVEYAPSGDEKSAQIVKQLVRLVVGEQN